MNVSSVRITKLYDNCQPDNANEWKLSVICAGTIVESQVFVRPKMVNDIDADLNTEVLATCGSLLSKYSKWDMNVTVFVAGYYKQDISRGCCYYNVSI